MLRPIDSPTRDVKQIVGLWDFSFDPDDLGVSEKWFAVFPDDSRRMALQTSINDIFTNNDEIDYVGYFWYRTKVKLPARRSANDVVGIYFESVTHSCDVWVDDLYLGSHQGGYLPFEFLIPNEKAGSFVHVSIRVDNRLNFQTMPPGIVYDSCGKRKISYWHDFYNYSGIHRPISLFVRPAVAFDDLTIVTEIEGKDGIVKFESSFSEPAAGIIRTVELFDRDGVSVGACSGETNEIRVNNANLWEPGNGYLYTMMFSALQDGNLLDSYTLRIGIRTVAIEGHAIKINGKRVYLKGFGMHEDHLSIGKGHNDAMMLQDFELMDWIHANSFRTSHYPYSESVLDYADEKGILVIDETPAVGLNMNVASGIFSADAVVTFSEKTINAASQQVHADTIRDLYLRDKNHPSVIIWSIANEPESQTENAEKYFKPLFELIHRLDPTRPAGFVNMALAPHGLCRVTQFADLIMINRYNGWYTETGDLNRGKAVLMAELEGWATENKPIIMTEYGADTQPGLRSLHVAPWTEEFQVEFLKMFHECFDAIPAMAGEHVWNFADFATAPGIMRVGGNKKGVFTRERTPKAAAYYLRSRWEKKKS